MRKQKRTKAALDVQLQQTIAWSTAITKMCKYVCSSATTAAIFWFIFLSIDRLAGGDTNANINVVFDVIKSRSVGTIVPMLLGVGGIAYGWRQHRTKISKVARLAERNKILEKAVNERRQSSRLDQKGSARQEDL